MALLNIYMVLGSHDMQFDYLEKSHPAAAAIN